MKKVHRFLCFMLVLCLMLPVLASCVGEQGPAGPQGETGATGAQGPQGPAGLAGANGEDGEDGTVITVGENGNWFLDGVDSGVSAKGVAGIAGTKIEIGENGNWLLDGVDSRISAQGAKGEGTVITVGENGNWFLDGADSGVPARGEQGETGATGPTGPQGPQGEQGETGATGPAGPQGPQGEQGEQGAAGKDGTVISIGANGNWYLDGVDSGVSAVGNANAPRYTYKHVVIVGVDGGGAWFDDADMPNVDAIFAKGATTDTCLASAPTISAQCWASLLTGVTPSEHGMDNTKAKANESYISTTYPTIFNLTQIADPAAELAVFGTWIGIRGLTEGIGIHREFFENGTKAERDRLTTDATVAYIKSNQPKLTFVQLDSADGAGESYGFGGSEHLAALANIDTMIGEIYGAVEEAGIADDTLFIVTADHGGNGKTHGGATPGEYNVFCGLTGKSLLAGEIEMYQRDIPAIVCWALGVGGNAKWDSYVPQGLFGDNKTPDARPALTSSLRPLDQTPGNLAEYVDISSLKAGLFFDGELTELAGKTATAVGTPTYESGYYGSAVRVSAGNYVSYSDLTFGSDSFSIALWVKPDKTNGSDVSIYSNKTWSSGHAAGFNMGWNNASALWFNAGGEARLDSKAGLEANHGFDWIHTLLAVDRTAGTVTTYINFVPVKTVSLPAGITSLDATYSFNLGCDGAGAYAFNGLLDDLLVFDSAMTEAEIASLAAYYSGDAASTAPQISGAIKDYLNLDKLRAGLMFDNYTATDMVGTHAATVKGTASFVEGYNGVGFETSVGNYISYENLKFGNDSFAVAMWVKVGSGNSGDPVVYGNQTWRNGRSLGFNFYWKNNVLYFNAGTASESQNDRTTVATPNLQEQASDWMHTLLIVDRAAHKVKIYVNFELVAEASLNASLGSQVMDGSSAGQTFTFNIGMDGLDDTNLDSGSGKVDCFKGSIDDFLLFDGVLTDAEIASLAAYYAQ